MDVYLCLFHSKLKVMLQLVCSGRGLYFCYGASSVVSSIMACVSEKPELLIVEFDVLVFK